MLLTSKRSKQSLLAWMVVGAGLFAGLANASEPLSLEQGTDLVKSRACLGCHMVDKKRLGPGFRQVAQRYAGRPDAVEHLVASIRNGGAGQWGAVPMPAQRQVSEEEATRIANWILSLEPK